MGPLLSLDTVQNAMHHHIKSWSETYKLTSNVGRDLMGYLTNRLWTAGHGDLMRASLTLAQTTLADKLGVSRRWVGEMLGRLEEAGWIEYYSPKLSATMRGPTTYKIGPQFKRLLIMLRKSRQKRKTPAIPDVNSSSQFYPSFASKNKDSILVPPSQEQIARNPLLKTWWERGKLPIPTTDK